MSISRTLRRRIAQQARSRCGYCLTQEVVSGIPLTIEHLIAKANGGTDDEENLWQSCRLCNEGKSDRSTAIDPETGIGVPLYNPRTQLWKEHFAWDKTGIQIIGLTAIGRATVQALGLNDELRVNARAIWVLTGYHPPSD